MTPDLKTEEGRKQSLFAINRACLFDLKDIGFNAADTIVVEVTHDYVRIGIKPYHPNRLDWVMEFGCEITIYANYERFGVKHDAELSFGCSSGFSPNDKESYWRTLHAASTLQLWDKICPIVDDSCERYRQLEEMIRKANKEPGEVSTAK